MCSMPRKSHIWARGMLKQQEGITVTATEEGMAVSIILLFHKSSTPQRGKMGGWGCVLWGGTVQHHVCGLAACFAFARRGFAMALLLSMMGRLVPSPTGLQCLCPSSSLLLWSRCTRQSPSLARPLAQSLPLLWQEQLTYRPRWQNSVFPLLSMHCTSLFGSIFLSLNFM